jgi:hypothetical protein
MPAVAAVDTPSVQVAQRLAALRTALGDDPDLPTRNEAHLLIGTWNVRAFSGLTGIWNSASGDSPKRNLTGVCSLAEIVRRFDVCAIQETRANLTAIADAAQTARADLGRHPDRRRAR